MIGMLLGAIVGSFIALLIVRWPSGELNLWGRSKCDHCETILPPRDLIPIISFILQNGKCTHCKKSIDPIHFQIEILAAIIGMILFAILPLNEAVIFALLGWQLLLIASLDIKYYWLPDGLTLALAATGLALAHILPTTPDIYDRIIGGFSAFIFLTCISMIYRKIRGYDGMGSGDPKLFGAMGMWIGWQGLAALMLYASILGLLWAAWLSFRKHNIDGDYKLPLGALLAFAMPITYFL